ncbi:hypothetical protein P7C73_g127, partial [Tremellales sp. Uapishka_1]
MPSVPDARFARLQTDPRFRKPKQKNLKVEIDERFRDVLESEEFGGTGSKGKGKGKGKLAVDKRGRPLASSHHADQLKRFYRLRSPEKGEEAEAEKPFIDYARGEGNLASSGSEDGSDDGNEDSEIEEEELEVGGKRSKRPIYDFSGSESESETDEDHLNIDLSEEEPSAFPEEKDAEEESEDESVPPTKRIAVVNLDWDNLRAGDLFTIFNSFSSAGGEGRSNGKLLDVKIYPSDFGKGRMEKEELEGPGGGIFISKPGEKKKGGKRKEQILLEESEDDQDYDEEDDEDEDRGGSDGGSAKGSVESGAGEEEEDGFSGGEEDEVYELEGEDPLEVVSDVESNAGSEDIDMDQLRQYQLERLRYYYAVASFSTVAAAESAMEELNGTEFERTANILDLSYVPEGMDFAEDEIKDEATKEPKAYKGNEFVTDALRHSKVRLTWDQDDPNRSKLTRRNLTREEIEEEDFKAYIASSGSEESSEDEGPVIDNAPPVESHAKERLEKRKAKKQAMKERTAKLRELLLGGGNDGDEGDIWGKAGLSRNVEPKKAEEDVEAMEITFRPGLSVSKGAENGSDEENMTSLEKYQRRMKERKERKKEKLELKHLSKASNDKKVVGAKDDFFGDESEEETPAAASGIVAKPKEMREAKEKSKETVPTATVIEDDSRHFSMKDIIKAEKGEGKKRRRTRPGKAKKEAEAEAMGRTRDVELGAEGWKIDTKDERFKALHEEPEFAIDPSNPHFTKTKAMKALLSERAEARRKKESKNGDGAEEPRRPAARLNDTVVAKEKDLNALVQSVKRKMDGQSRGRKRSKK